MSLFRSPARSLPLLVALLLPLAASPSHARQETGEGLADALPAEWVEAMEWQAIGPANMSGRITALAVYEEDPSTWWAASAGGGLLKTENNGVTFEHQFDREATVSIGDVAVAPSDRDVVWVGTGESNPRNSVSWGDGVYKSTDGGRHWKNMGLRESYQIGRIAIHPSDPDVVYVGALGRLWGPNEERGLYRTTDGGETWKRILHVDEDTGVVDVELSPEDPDTLLVATYVRRRDGFDTNDPAVKWGAGAGIWKSTDGGDSFRRVEGGLPSVDLGRIDLSWYRKDPKIVYAVVESSKIGKEPEDAPYFGARGEDADVGARLTELEEDGAAAQAGLKAGDILIAIDGRVVHSNADMAAKVRGYKAGDTVAVEVSRERESVTCELTFTRRPEPQEDAEEEEEEGAAARRRRRAPSDPFGTRLGGQIPNVQEQQGADGHEYGGVYRSEDGGESWTRINSLNPRPMYFSQIRVDPSDDSRLYVLGIQMHRSVDRGETFTGDGAPRGVHVDHHALWVDPGDGRHMILGNDGGVYVTWDRGASWDHMNHAAIGQFYHVAVGPRRDYRVYGGLQDNGSWGSARRSRSGGSVNEDWMRIGGGDGFVCAVDPEDPDQLYFESQNGGMGRRNLRTGERGSIRPRAPRGTRYRFNWKTPFLLSHHNSGLFYTAGNHVFRSLTRGDRLEPISPEITRGDRGSATALAESPRDPSVLYVGTDDGALWGTKDGGATWSDLFETVPAEAVAQAGTGTSVETGSEAPAAPPEENGAADAPPDAVEVSADDVVSGTWSGRALGEEIPSGEGAFSFDLVLDADGAVRGEIRTQMGDGPIQDGRYEAERGRLYFRFEGERMPLDVSADVEGDRMTGTLSVGGGVFEIEFEAKRTARAQPEAARSGQRGARRRQEPAKEGGTLAGLVPQPMWVSSLEASRFEDGRVYVTLDGHRSDDDRPYALASEDHGATWRSLTADLPAEAGSARVLREDLVNPDLLYLGAEFGAWASIDRGRTWTPMHGGLPTVAVHEIAQHATAGEIVAATHGRSLWVLDVTALRQMSTASPEERALLYSPKTVVYWHDGPARGGSLRRFEGDNPYGGAEVYYSLGRDARRVSLEVQDADGEVLHAFEPQTARGLHFARWDLRRAAQEGSRRRGPRVAPGTYRVVLAVDDLRITRPLVVEGDPDHPGVVLWGEVYDEWLDAGRAHDELGDEGTGGR